MSSELLSAKLSTLNAVFTPSAPIIARDFFFGRYKQLGDIVEAINERGQHAVVFGERGVGKTSLANIVNNDLKGILVAKVACNRNDTFKDIWIRLLKRISFTVRQPGMGFAAVESEEKYQYDLFLPREAQEIDSGDLLMVFGRLTNQVLFILDEFDSIATEKTRTLVADAIKAFSDSAPHVTLMIVGIAESVSQLVGVHPSNERCIKQIKLPRMSPDELGQIVSKGLEALEMTIDPLVQLDIIEFSQGFPHYTHLLAKYSAKTALEANSQHIDRRAFDIAIEEAVENVQESIREAYQRSVMTVRKDSIFEDVLSACALARLDEHGTFRAMDLEGHLATLTGEPVKLQAYTYHLGKLCHEDRGCILQRIEFGSQHRYKFRNPLIRAFVRLKLYQSGKLGGRAVEPK